MIRIVRKFGFKSAVVGAVVAVSAGSWVLAEQAKSSRQLAAEAAPPSPSVITVPVEFEQLARTATLNCTSEPAKSVPVPVIAPEGTEPIVTRIPVKEGKRVGEGTVVLEVSGRPILLIEGDLPAYRDLAPGAQGPDVRQFQQALARMGYLDEVSGRFDDATRRAVAGMYKALGYPAPTSGGSSPAPPQSTGADGASPENSDESAPSASVMLPRSELLAVDSLPLRVGPIDARVGSKAESGQVSLEGTTSRLRCPVTDSGVIVDLEKGDKAEIESSSGEKTGGKVLRIVTTGEEEQKQTEALIKPSDPDSVDRGKELRARVVVEEAAEAGPVVPASALWSRPGEKTVVLVLRNGEQHEVLVEPGFEVDGRVLLTAGNLKEGDEVVVSAGNAVGGGR